MGSLIQFLHWSRGLRVVFVRYVLFIGPLNLVRKPIPKYARQGIRSCPVATCIMGPTAEGGWYVEEIKTAVWQTTLGIHQETWRLSLMKGLCTENKFYCCDQLLSGINIFLAKLKSDSVFVWLVLKDINSLPDMQALWALYVLLWPFTWQRLGPVCCHVSSLIVVDLWDVWNPQCNSTSRESSDNQERPAKPWVLLVICALWSCIRSIWKSGSGIGWTLYLSSNFLNSEMLENQILGLLHCN